jgi:uncharacterized protein (TIGR02265 family)
MSPPWIKTGKSRRIHFLGLRVAVGTLARVFAPRPPARSMDDAGHVPWNGNSDNSGRLGRAKLSARGVDNRAAGDLGTPGLPARGAMFRIVGSSAWGESVIGIEQAAAFAQDLNLSDDELKRLARSLARFPPSIRVRGLFVEGLSRIVTRHGGRDAFVAMAARAGIDPDRPAFHFFLHRDFYKLYLLAARDRHPRQSLARSLYELAQSFYPMFRGSLLGNAMSLLIGKNASRLVRLLPEAYLHSVQGNEHKVEMVSEREYRWSCTVEPFDDYPSIFSGIIEGALRAHNAPLARVETIGSVLGVSSHKFLFKISW